MDNQERVMRPIPKNVRQIGESDGDLRLYVEDYVNTFVRKCARTNRPVLGALVGDWYVQEDKEYLFVEGAIRVEGFELSEARVRMTDEAWSGLYGTLEEFFNGRTVCGWFWCSAEAENCEVSMLREFMYENMGGEKRVMIICDTEQEEETYFVYDRNFIREQSGYYLFYERNEPMQSYMVTTSVAVRTDPVAVDAAASLIRTRTVDRITMPERPPEYSMLSAAVMIIGVIALAFGIVTFGHYEQLREMESVLTNLAGSILENQGKEEPGDKESTTEEYSDQQTASGGLIIEDVEAGVTQTEEETEPETQENEETSAAESEKENEAESETEQMTEVAAPDYRTYVVEAGETLVSICWTVYGYRDEEIIRQICEINQISDKDQIYVGQELLIP